MVSWSGVHRRLIRLCELHRVKNKPIQKTSNPLIALFNALPVFAGVDQPMNFARITWVWTAWMQKDIFFKIALTMSNSNFEELVLCRVTFIGYFSFFLVSHTIFSSHVQPNHEAWSKLKHIRFSHQTYICAQFNGGALLRLLIILIFYVLTSYLWHLFCTSFL